MSDLPAPLPRSARTLSLMLRMYCHAHHGTTGSRLCAQCFALSSYALDRLQRCPHGRRKPVCSRCVTHCYSPDERSAIRAVMRFAGPRMALRHPWLSLLHFVDTLRPVPR